jgi:hypothetical protein
MMLNRRTRATPAERSAWLIGGGIAAASVAATAYAACAGRAWLRYGHPRPPIEGEVDALLDRFMPVYDVAERHRMHVAAPAAITFAASMDMSLDDSLAIRAIFKGRELLLGATPAANPGGRSLVETTKSLGWVVLAEVPGHELVMGAVTRPWQADVVFRSVPAEQFAAFAEPDYVKIVWTLRADSAIGGSTARSETRAVATDGEARRKFRWYWARFSVGIVLIREFAQRLIKREAERRAHALSGNATEIVVPPVSGTSI